MKFRFWPTLLTMIMLPVLLGLGAWQVQRLHWKENLLATIDARVHQTPVDLVSIINRDDSDYRLAKVSGSFLNDKSLYLLSISLTGDGGYHVLTPLRLEDERLLLVDRGWIPYDWRDKDFSRPNETQTLTGVLRLPQNHMLFQPQNDPAKNIWYRIDLDAMASATKLPQFLPYILELDATPNLGGYPVGGQTRLTLPNNHFVYAVTWFGLAFALVIIYILSSVRKGSSS